MKVFITRNIPGNCIQTLKDNNIEVKVNPYDRELSSEEIIKYAEDCSALITLLSDKIDKNIIDKIKDLRVISNYAVGYNNIDFEYAKQKGIIVTNTPDVLTQTTADLGFALLMAVARKIPQAHEWTKQGNFKGWEPELFLGNDIYKKDIGIIGYGRIGQAISKRANGFSMNIRYNSRSPKKNPDGVKAIYSSIDEIAQKSDFIILTCPLNKDSYHLINRDFLSKMKKTAVIINIARGPVWDEAEVIDFLKHKKISGAGFDVYEDEPRFSEELKNMDNVVILPHIGSASNETRAKMGQICANAIVDVLTKNKKPENSI
jgi:glyoxylate reductase